MTTYECEYFLKRQFNNWNPDKFNWKYSSRLANKCRNYIYIWWDSDRYNWDEYTFLLIECCSKDFNIWYNEKFKWKDGCYLYLNRHCKEYKYIWIKDYIIWKLEKE
jgi:hypothetical protein|tara:strand:+ start:3571 stop:3888 length:318 start_codon:yes stop_codon:yes gene_type:complete